MSDEPARERFSALRRLFRTTAVRLSAIYIVVFTVFSLFLVVAVTHEAARVVDRQLVEAIAVEVDTLLDDYRDGGLVRLVTTLDERARRPDAGLFYVVDPNGNPVAGNVAELPLQAVIEDDDEPHRLAYSRFEDGREARHVALVRSFTLENGFHVLVGRDIGERERFRSVFRKAFRWIAGAMVVLAGLTWWFLARRVLKRIDQVSEASRRIVAGDLSGRLPVSGSGDEFDRLAVSLNDMLAKIGELMKGLKEVSDNIAHDLKTPLTRLRNRLEAALAEPEDADGHRRALEAAIEESDGLIRTFDALLMIARVEAGSSLATADEVDLAEIAREVGELYEPVAEDAGVALSVEAEGSVKLVGVRELLAQALVNLVDNALKHGRSEGREAKVTISVGREGDRAVLSVADAGPGVPEADRTRVLDRFTRLEASRNAPGSGLGLALVAAVARHHRGTIELSDAAPGLMVTIRLPTA
ncbi:MAG: HAMP domain-containing histidine kinase [Siculibacillus sp.]|nr:HAMP domain-containing histidine kinase [Siculibacillus sp.]